MRTLSGTILVVVLAIMPVVGRAASGTIEALLQHSEVQTELKLSSQQIDKIRTITRAVRAKHQEEFDRLRDLGVEERRRQEADLVRIVSQETMKALGDTLEPGQAKRVRQIYLQRQGLQAFADPTVQEALRLTDDQRAKLKILAEDAAKEARKLFDPRAQNSFQQALKKVEGVRRAAIERAVALLTDEQKKIWRELIGEPFQVKSDPPLIRPPSMSDPEA